MGFELDPAYKDVPTRIADFKAKHPEGCLRPVNPEQPYDVVTIGSQFFIVYSAAAYRAPDDPMPGIGVAWEPFPGKTPYTANSELQNAETSAWGRAIVAVLASESKAVASAEDVRNRQADADVKPVERHLTPEGELIEVWAGEVWVNDAKARLVEACGGDKGKAGATWTEARLDGKWKVTAEQLAEVLAAAAETLEDPQEGTGTAEPAPAPTEGEAEPSPNGSASPPAQEDQPSALADMKARAEAIADKAAKSKGGRS